MLDERDHSWNDLGEELSKSSGSTHKGSDTRMSLACSIVGKEADVAGTMVSGGEDSC